MGYMYGAANRDMDEYGYKRTELMLDPLSIAKTIALDTFKLGQANCYYGHTLDKLERHSLSDQSEGLPNLTDLGVTPMPMTDRVRHDAKAWDHWPLCLNWFRHLSDSSYMKTGPGEIQCSV